MFANRPGCPPQRMSLVRTATTLHASTSPSRPPMVAPTLPWFGCRWFVSTVPKGRGSYGVSGKLTGRFALRCCLWPVSNWLRQHYANVTNIISDMSATGQTRLTDRCMVKAISLGDGQMNDKSSSYRTDEQLQSILHDTANWVIHGRAGFALGHSASLREALDKSAKLAMSGATMAAITRLPSDNITIFPAQIDRLRKIVAGLEAAVVTETVWSDAAN
jgi:hypothetical protein